mgnify:CR=1 FL=1
MKRLHRLLLMIFLSLFIIPFTGCELEESDTDPVIDNTPEEDGFLTGPYGENGFDDQVSMDFANYVLRETNFARTDPDGYAEERLLSYYNSGSDNGAYSDLKNNYSAVGALTINTKLNAAADKYAKVMGDGDFLDHGDMEGRIEAEGYEWSTIGENIAWSGFPAADATADAEKAGIEFVLQWIIDDGVASLGHRKNIMEGSFTEIGVGYYKVEDTGIGYDKHYSVQDFGAPSSAE